MSKYTKEFKLKIVKEYLNGNIGYGALAKKYNVPKHEQIRRWIKRYQEHGIDGLERNNISYDGNFKISVVEYMHNNHLSLSEVAARFNLGGENLVGRWERIYYEEGPQALFRENRGRKNKMNNKKNNKPLSTMSKEELLEENEYLRMENAYLKKLQALIQERDKPQKKKK